MRHTLTFLRTHRASFLVALLSAVFFVGCTQTTYAFEEQISGFIYSLATALGGFFLGLGGVLLDLSLRHFVVEMGTQFVGTDGGAAGIGIAVNDFWTMIRDILNMFFIYGLIFIGIKTILNSEDSGTRRALGQLIAAAILVNFSLYITQVIIDFSNLMATQVYVQMLDGSSGDFSNNVFDSGKNKSISGAFMQATHVTSWFGDNDAQLGESVGGVLKVIAYSLMMMFFLILAAMFFAFGAIMLITRFILLTLYMVFSPVMFLGWVIPNFQGISKDWWKGFFKQCFFAPIYIFMLYLSLQVTALLSEQMSASKFSGAFEGGKASADNFTMFLYFIVMIGLLYASVKVGQKMSIVGAGGMLKTAGKFGGGLSAGMAARAGRITLGRLAHNASGSEALKDAASKRGIMGTLSRGALSATTKVGDASFDARRIGGVGKKLGVGEGKKGGYKTRLSEVAKSEAAFAKSLGEVGNDDPEVMRLQNEKKSHEKKLIELKRLKAEGIETTEDGRKVSDEIHKVNRIVETSDVRIKQEKARRQTGSAKAEQEKQIADTILSELKENKKELQKKYKNTKSKEEKTVLKQKIKENAEDIKISAREVRKKNKGALGYANVLETKNFIESASFGRITEMDHKAGKAIREATQKKIKKSKEDSFLDSLADKIESSSKKEDS